MLISEVSQRSILSLKAPISFICSRYCFPIAQMENQWLPSAADIIEAINETTDF